MEQDGLDAHSVVACHIYDNVSDTIGTDAELARFIVVDVGDGELGLVNQIRILEQELGDSAVLLVLAALHDLLQGSRYRVRVTGFKVQALDLLLVFQTEERAVLRVDERWCVESVDVLSKKHVKTIRFGFRDAQFFSQQCRDGFLRE